MEDARIGKYYANDYGYVVQFVEIGINKVDDNSWVKCRTGLCADLTFESYTHYRLYKFVEWYKPISKLEVICLG